MLLQAPAPQDEHFARILERDWHADIIDFVRYSLPRLIIVLLIAFLMQRLVLFFVKRLRAHANLQVGNSQRAAQLRTMAALLRATSYSIIGFIALLHTLSIFNINLTPLLASAGVLGVGVGLGAQSLFKDMINGIFILVEDQYSVGDTVKIAGLQGVVEDLTFRLTRLRAGDGTLYSIPNSQIATVSNLSRDFSIASLQVSVDASANPDQVLDILSHVATDTRNDPAFKQVVIADPDVLGVNDIRGREAVYLVNIRVRANQRDPVLRELRRRVLLAFEKHRIPIGNTGLVLVQTHDPTAPPGQQSLLGG